MMSARLRDARAISGLPLRIPGRRTCVSLNSQMSRSHCSCPRLDYEVPPDWQFLSLLIPSLFWNEKGRIHEMRNDYAIMNGFVKGGQRLKDKESVDP